jgi:hypothetical protein
MKSGWQDLLLFCPPQICFRSSMKSASKLGVARTTPDRAKSRNASAFSPHVEHNDGTVNDPGPKLVIWPLTVVFLKLPL